MLLLSTLRTASLKSISKGLVYIAILSVIVWYSYHAYLQFQSQSYYPLNDLSNIVNTYSTGTNPESKVRDHIEEEVKNTNSPIYGWELQQVKTINQDGNPVVQASIYNEKHGKTLTWSSFAR